MKADDLPIGTVLHPTYLGAPDSLEYHKVDNGWSREMPAGGYVDSELVDALLARGQYEIRRQSGGDLTTVKYLLARVESYREQVRSLRECIESNLREALAEMPVGTVLHWIPVKDTRFRRAPDGWRGFNERADLMNDEWIESGFVHGDLVLEEGQ